MLSLTKELDRVGGGGASAGDRAVVSSSAGETATGPQDTDCIEPRQDRITSGPAAGVDRQTRHQQDVEPETQATAAPAIVQVWV